jgi:hypothetical protein
MNDISERFFEPEGTARTDRPEPGTLLDDVRAFTRRFVVMSDDQADAVALWTAHTHAVAAADSTPYLAVTSAVKRSGKTRLREVLGLLVHAPLTASNISDAALFRAVEQLTPTLLLDEADAVFKAREREDLRGMLNAGYRRGAVAYRMGGANKTTLESFPVFCAKAFFGIGDFLPDTLSDRAIHVRLERRLREESVERYRERIASPEGHELRDRLADWLEPQVDYLTELHPDLPDELDDRAQDSWEVLLAIADLAGGDWPERARRAALALSSGEEREDDGLSTQLLRDIQAVFAGDVHARIKTSDLLEQLQAIEESPWADWYGKPLSANGLSRLLRPYRIKTMSVKVEGEAKRGFKAEQFADTFARVLGVTGVTGVTSESTSQNEVTLGNTLEIESVTSDSAQQAEGNAGNAGNTYHANGLPLIGDEGFPELVLAPAWKAKQLRTTERDARMRLHELIRESRAT